MTSPYPVKLTPAETRLVFVLQKFFAPQNILVDCYFPKVETEWERQRKKLKLTTQADLTQVDCVAVNESGLFVFESKDLVGWIYAHGDRRYWVQTSAYGRNKNQFYNPVWQNATHVAALRDLATKVPIYSVIVFGRETTLKVLADIPAECEVCTQGNLRAVLQRLSAQKVLTTSEVENLVQAVKRGRVDPNENIRAQHIGEVPRGG